MLSRTTLYANFTAVEHANFLAAKVVAHATAFLDGRNDAELLARNVRSVMCELIAAPDEPAANLMLAPARMLVVAMMGAASSEPGIRQDRWMAVMGSLVDLVRQECGAARCTQSSAPIDGTMA